MALVAPDRAYLADRGHVYEVREEAGMTCVLFPDWPVPAGLQPATATLLVRLQPGYPDIPPDMWWFDPPIRRINGGEIPGTGATETHLGRPWQRWSRHFQQGQWQSGTDSLESYLALIQRELQRATTT